MSIFDMLLANAMGEGGGGGGGSSDFSTAEVTFVQGESPISVLVPSVSTFGDYSGALVQLEDSVTVTVILYKGSAEAWSAVADVVAVTGSATIDDGIAYITGNCTVTFE